MKRRRLTRARVWLYRDGELLPEGFEAKAATADAAIVPALIAAAESYGLEVCISINAKGTPDIKKGIDATEVKP